MKHIDPPTLTANYCTKCYRYACPCCASHHTIITSGHSSMRQGVMMRKSRWDCRHCGQRFFVVDTEKHHAEILRLRNGGAA